MKLLIPGKTFLVGEYSVLLGAEAIGLATQPEFEFTINKDPLKEGLNFHPESAAGLYKTNHPEISFQLSSHQKGAKGFGYSTAEYLALFSFMHNHKNSDFRTNLIIAFNNYRDLFNSAHLVKKKPSGADLVFQVLGRISIFNKDLSQSKQIAWPFLDIGFDILSTGLKVDTHTHLDELNLSTVESLISFSDDVISSYKAQNEIDFFKLLKAWSNELYKNGLQHNFSHVLINKLYDCPYIINAKPNGALGADTILIFYKKQNQKIVRDYISHLNLNRISSSEELSEGAHYVD